MRTALYLGRLCIRQKSQRLTSTTSTLVRHGRQVWLPARARSWWKYPPLPHGGKVTVISLLSPAAFVALSEEANDDGKTAEEHMLEASRAEIAKELPEDIHGWKRLWKGIYLGFDLYIYEPIATTLRFLHLVIIFIPVLATTPIIWVGGRNREHDNERSGTLWWYSFLVHSMERAGPAFIKVCHNHKSDKARTDAP